MPRPKVGQAVECIDDTRFIRDHSKWHAGKRGVVTGQVHGGDVYIDGDSWSVSTDRLKVIGGTVYQMTDVRDENAAGTLLELQPGERFVVDVSGVDAVLLYLDRDQRNPHYTDKNDVWVNELLRAGVIRVMGDNPVHDVPHTYNSVYDAPIGMVVSYVLNGEPNKGAIYPFIVRTWSGVWGCTKKGNWIHIPEKHDGPWLEDVQAAWSCPAYFEEAFVYPMPTKAILYAQKIMGAANA